MRNLGQPIEPHGLLRHLMEEGFWLDLPFKVVDVVNEHDIWGADRTSFEPVKSTLEDTLRDHHLVR